MNRHVRRIRDERTRGVEQRAREIEPLADVDRDGRRLQHRAHLLRHLHETVVEELELRGILAEKRVAPEEANVVLGELLEGGLIDDAAFARRFADDRRRLDAWGSERIARRLRELGVAPDLVAAAVGEQDREDELEAAIALLRRRVPGVPATPRERDRALGMLVRKGYGLELAYDALRRYAGVDEPLD